MSNYKVLPYPIASLYQEMLDTPEPGHRLRALVRAFSGILKFMSLLAIGDYLDMNATDPEVDALLTGPNLSRPSLGHWNQFLREIVNYHKRIHKTLRISGLMDFYKKSNKKLIDDFLRLRNEYVHPDIWPGAALADQLVKQYQPLLDQLIDSAAFLADYRFTHQKSGRKRLCMGPSLDGFVELPYDPSQPEGFDLERDDEPPLPFLAFLVLTDTGVSGPELSGISSDGAGDADILMYESRVARRIKYIRGNRLAYRGEEAFATSNVALTRLKERLGDNEEHAQAAFRQANAELPDWQRLRENSRQMSEKAISVHKQERKYEPRFYINRSHIEATFKEFLTSPQSVCVLVGDSGCGKTNLLCHLTEDSLKIGHAVLHFYARNYDGSGLTSIVASQLVPNINQFGPYLAALGRLPELAGNHKLILIIDAINEYSDPSALMREIIHLDDLLRAEGAHYCKIVLSCRTATWSNLEREAEEAESKQEAKPNRRERFYFDIAPSATAERPYITIGPFTAEETEKAYNKYAIGAAETPQQRRLKSEYFGIRLKTPFKDLPAGLKHLVANPIFLRYLVTSYEEVTQELSEAEILMKFYEEKIERRHQFFLAYFLDVLWHKRSDYLPEEELFARHPSQTLSIEQALNKLREYCDEDPVNARSTRLVCEYNDPHNKIPCERYGVAIPREEALGGTCSACGNLLFEREVAMRSTFFFLQDEGIVSIYRSNAGAAVLRFTYDRFFEIMMARHLVFRLYRDTPDYQQQIAQVLAWIDDSTFSPIYLEVFVHLVALLAGYSAVDYEGAVDEVNYNLDGTPGVLYKLQRKLFGTEAETLLETLVDTDKARAMLVARRALVQVGRSREAASEIRPYIERLSKKVGGLNRPDPRQFEYVRLSLAVAAELGYWEPFVALADHSSSAVRTLAVCQAYFLWRKDPDRGLGLLKRCSNGLFGWFAIPRLRPLEFFVGTSVLMLFRHPREPQMVANIVVLLRTVFDRIGPWLVTLLVFFPLVLTRLLKEVPSDYNPVNFAEFEYCRRDIAQNPALRSVLVRYARLLRADRFDLTEQANCIKRIQELSPHNDIAYTIHQLAQARHAADFGVSSAVQLECRIGMEAPVSHGLWLQAPLYTSLWLLSRTPRIEDSDFEAVTALWKRVCETRSFAFAGLTPDSAYHNWSVFYYALLVYKRTGSFRVDDIKDLLRDLVARDDKTGLYALFRGIDTVAAELSSMYPETLELVRLAIPQLLEACPNLPDTNINKLAETLQRMRVLYADIVEHILDMVGNRETQDRLRQAMSTFQVNENIGALIGSGGQDFYLYAMGMPQWRENLSRFMEFLVTARSISQWLRKGFRLLRKELYSASGD